ncbi:MAG: hypothetical protein Q8928_04755 [Bacteroidota bacterium]|nr:hypothetical protein [Bacteroidota bacterium]
MNIDEIKLDIKEQISKTNQVFNYNKGLYLNEVLTDNPDSLRNSLKNVTGYFTFYNAMSIAFSAILVVF